MHGVGMSEILHISNRITDQGGEVVECPLTRTGGKAVWTRIRQPGRPETQHELLWSAHEKLTIRRMAR